MTSLSSIYKEPLLSQQLRAGLLTALDEAIALQQWSRAAGLLAATIDTWPLAGAMNQALLHWQSRDSLALAILFRAKEVASLVGVSAEIPLAEELPELLSVRGEELVDLRRELCAKAAKGELLAVRITTPVPSDPASQLAYGELRMEAKAQRAVDMYGAYGLLAPDAPSWTEALKSWEGGAPSGQQKPDGLSWNQVEFRRMVDLAQLPGMPGRLVAGDTTPIWWLLWNGPARPLPISDDAAQVLRALSGGFTVAAEACSIQEEQLEGMIREFVQLGVLSVVPR